MTFVEILKFSIDLLAVFLLALGIKGLSKVRSAREANRLAAIAMTLAVVGVLVDSFGSSGISVVAWIWIVFGSLVGGVLGLITAKRVAMTAMPETVALFNGCGGMSSLLVALAVALFACCGCTTTRRQAHGLGAGWLLASCFCSPEANACCCCLLEAPGGG